MSEEQPVLYFMLFYYFTCLQICHCEGDVLSGLFSADVGHLHLYLDGLSQEKVHQRKTRGLCKLECWVSARIMRTGRE